MNTLISLETKIKLHLENLLKKRSHLALALPLLLLMVWVTIDHRRSWDWIYTHWLFDYHFGFMKRALIGNLFQSLRQVFFQSSLIPLTWVKIISWVVASVFSLLFCLIFYDFYQKMPSLKANARFYLFFYFCLLSPLSLRNYYYDLGRFDQISMMLIYLQWFTFPAWATLLGAIFVILNHENFIFIFLPALTLILVSKKQYRTAILLLVVSLITTAAVFLKGAPGTSMETFWNYLLSKANAPLDHNVEFFYWTVKDQLENNGHHLALQLSYAYGYFIYLGYLLPVYLCATQYLLSPIERFLRFGILCGYLAIVILTCDWCRHFANAFFIYTFLSLFYWRHFMQEPKILFENKFSLNRMSGLLIFGLLIPAAGVEIPRLVKIVEFIKLHFYLHQ